MAHLKGVQSPTNINRYMCVYNTLGSRSAICIFCCLLHQNRASALFQVVLSRVQGGVFPQNAAAAFLISAHFSVVKDAAELTNFSRQCTWLLTKHL